MNVEIAFWGLLFWVSQTGRIAYCQKWIWRASWDQIPLRSKHRRLGMKECCAGRQQKCKALLSAEGLCLSCCVTILQTVESELWKPKVSCKCSSGKYSVGFHCSVMPPFSSCSLFLLRWKMNSQALSKANKAHCWSRFNISSPRLGWTCDYSSREPDFSCCFAHLPNVASSAWKSYTAFKTL